MCSTAFQQHLFDRKFFHFGNSPLIFLVGNKTFHICDSDFLEIPIIEYFNVELVELLYCFRVVAKLFRTCPTTYMM